MTGKDVFLMVTENRPPPLGGGLSNGAKVVTLFQIAKKSGKKSFGMTTFSYSGKK